MRDHQEEVNKLRGKEAMFRTIILDQAGVQKISDDEILQGFLKLRQDIQKLSRSASYLVDTNPTITAAQQETTPSLTSFYREATWGQLGLVDRRLRMRAKIFDELHFHILGYNCFGLQGFQSDVGALLGPVEPGLRRFEVILQDRGGKRLFLLQLDVSPFHKFNYLAYPVTPRTNKVYLQLARTSLPIGGLRLSTALNSLESRRKRASSRRPTYSPFLPRSFPSMSGRRRRMSLAPQSWTYVRMRLNCV